MAKANFQHREAEVSLMQNAMKDKSTIFNSELVNLRSTLQNQRYQRHQNAQRFRFIDAETRSYFTKKLMMFRDEFQQESMAFQAMVQSEGEVAKLYKGRWRILQVES